MAQNNQQQPIIIQHKSEQEVDLKAKAKQLAGWSMLVFLALLAIIIGLEGNIGQFLAIAFTPDHITVLQ